MSDETTLLPCPFCGGEAAIVPTLDTTVREWFVTCGNLECNVLACRTKRYYTEAEAIAAWNTRSTYGTLTAEQVEKAIHDCSTYASYDGCTYYASGIRLQAIADELNARAERTCHAESDLSEWVCSACQCWIPLGLTPENIKHASEWRYCPHCGARVKAAKQ